GEQHEKDGRNPRRVEKRECAKGQSCSVPSHSICSVTRRRKSPRTELYVAVAYEGKESRFGDAGVPSTSRSADTSFACKRRVECVTISGGSAPASRRAKRSFEKRRS